MSIRRLAAGKFTLLIAAWSVLGGCEAPLDLSGVEAQRAEPVRRFDQFKSSAATDKRLIVVGDHGVVLTSVDQGKSWSRQELEGNPYLASVTACPDGSIVALDRYRRVWLSENANDTSNHWESRDISTAEPTLSISCDTHNQLWVTAGFSTILSSRDKGKTWTGVSQDEDMQFGTIQFVSDDYAVVTGEFGAFFVSRDGGMSWERGSDIPDEFFPLAAHFADKNTGWVSGLNGTILHTNDGGANWQRQDTGTQSPLYYLIANTGRVYAAGDSGVLLQLLGQHWVDVKQNKQVRSYNIAMAALGDDQLLVAGGAGTLGVVTITGDAALVKTESNDKTEKRAQL